MMCTITGTAHPDCRWKVVARGEPKNADDLMVTRKDLPNVAVLAGPFWTRRKARVAKGLLVRIRNLGRSDYKEGCEDDVIYRRNRIFLYGPGNE